MSQIITLAVGAVLSVVVVVGGVSASSPSTKPVSEQQLYSYAN